MTAAVDVDPTIGSQTLVSIITPSLNQGRYIETALASVRGQSYRNIEHVVVDGGSSDETLAILGQARESGTINFISESDVGMYDALNKGLRMATGEILGYLNCDDAYTPWAVETAVRVLEANPDADAVFGDGLTVDESNGRQRLSFIPPFDHASLALTGSLVQPAVFWRRSAYERVGDFDARLRFVGDLDYWLRIGASGRFVRVDEILAIERHHDASLSRASAGAMAVEDAAMRARHRRGSAVARLLARARAAAWRRRLLARFLRATRNSDAAYGPWDGMIAGGHVRVDPGRVVLSLIPRFGAAFAWDAIRSERRWFEPGGAAPATHLGATVPD